VRPNPREMADGLLEVRFGCSRFQNAMTENIVIKFSDIMTFCVYSDNDKSIYHRIMRGTVVYLVQLGQLIITLNDFAPE
jgi:hypothetical protein